MAFGVAPNQTETVDVDSWIASYAA
jgi:hypothetical protein